MKSFNCIWMLFHLTVGVLCCFASNLLYIQEIYLLNFGYIKKIKFRDVTNVK